MRIAFTGGRDYTNAHVVCCVLDMLDWHNHVLLVGDCPTGLDFIVQKETDRCEVFRANWDKHGKAAGPIRNGEMLHEADFLIAFPGGKGTENCVKQAKEMGITVLRIEE